MPTDPPRHAVSHHLRVDGLSLHCLEYPGDGPPLVLLHSLTGNARIFDGLILAGLADRFRVLVPEMCGRGQSETAFTQLSLADGLLLLVALGAVFVILVVVYRSPLLPLLVLLTSVFALCVALLTVLERLARRLRATGSTW